MATSPKIGLGAAPALPPFNVYTALTSLYKLKVIKQQNQETLLVSFRDKLTMQDIVDRCKSYCTKNNLRFVYVEPAVVSMDSDIVDAD